jgi:hypothetical protein
MANSIWTAPVPVTDRSAVTVQPFSAADYSAHTVDPNKLRVENQWRVAKSSGVLRNHGASINTTETGAVR